MTELTFEQINYSAKETGVEIRRALRAAFPGVKFSLRGSRGTGYGWFSLSWSDGPTCRQVDAVTNGFRSSYFDGMDDSNHSIPATMYAGEDGVIREHRFTCHGVNTQRDYSPEADAWARAYVDAHGGLEVFCTDHWPDYHIAVHRVLSGVDMVGVDWGQVPEPSRGWTGRRVASSYCVDTYVTGYEYAGTHRATVSA